MLNIVIPMAGRGSRFAHAGYIVPKPLIPVHGVPMIKLVIANVRPSGPHRFIFICQRTHVAEYALREKLNSWAPSCAIVELEEVTEGAACTVLMAASHVDNNHPLMIANSDQFVNVVIDSYISTVEQRNLDGLIMTMTADDPKWSFAEVNGDGLLTRVVEKEVISPHATVGIYNYRRGRDFVAAAQEMIRKNLRVNNEFYVAPAYNEMVKSGSRIGIFDIGSHGDGMYGLGTPDDLAAFLALPVSQRATEALR